MVARGEMQDRVRNVLLSYGTQDISISIDDLVGKTTLSYSQVYQTLYRLQQMGEIEIIKEDGVQRPKVTGIKLRRMENKESITERIQEQEAERKTSRDINKVSELIPATKTYINKRIAVERAKEELIKAKVDDSIINFEPEPLGEEAIYLLQELTEALKENVLLTNDLAAEKRNAEYFKAQISSRTFDDSGT